MDHDFCKIYPVQTVHGYNFEKGQENILPSNFIVLYNWTERELSEDGTKNNHFTVQYLWYVRY